MELAALVSPILFLGVAEIYIQKVLLESKITKEYVKASATEEPELIQSAKTNSDEYHKLVDSKFSVTLLNSSIQVIDVVS